MATRALLEGRIQDYAWLEIDDIVMRWRETLYSSDNAVANWSIINNDPRTALESSSIQAEVLVKRGLNVKWIKFPDDKKSESIKLSTSFVDFDGDIPY
jgi:hypothetical protein